MTRATADNLFGLSDYIVDPSAAHGSFTTIQAALNAIAAGPGLGVIYIKPGTYVESPAIAAGQGVHLIGVQATSNNAAVLIQGTITIGAGSGCGFENLLIGFTAANALNMANSANLNCDDCHFFSTGSVAVVVNDPGATLTLHDCIVQTAAVNDAFQNFSSTTCVFEDTEFFASAGSAMSLVGASNTVFNSCSFDSTAVIGGTATGTFIYCTHNFATGEAYAIGAGTTVHAYNNIINTVDGSGFWATGTGTLNYGDIVLLSDTGIDPGLTQSPKDWKPYATTSSVGVSRYNPAQFSVNSSTAEVSLLSSALFTWNTTAANVANMSVNNGYFCISAGGALTLGLPATSVLGDTVRVSLDGATSWQITQAAGQQIRLGNTTTTLGAGGSLTSTAQGDSIYLVCRVANTLWTAESSIGTITVV